MKNNFNFFIGKIVLCVFLILTLLLINYFIDIFNNSITVSDNSQMITLKNISEEFFENAFNLNGVIASEEIIKKCLTDKRDWNSYIKEYNKKYAVKKGIDKNSGLEYLAGIHKNYQFIELLFLQDMDGKQKARSFGPLGDRKDRWWFKRYLDNIFTPFVSKSYYSKTGDIPVVSIFHTVFDNNGNHIGVIGMDVNLNKLRDKILKSVYSEDKICMLIDNEGIIIVHPDSSVISEIYNLKKMEKEELVRDEKGATLQVIDGHHKTRIAAINWDERIPGIVNDILNGKSGVFNDISINNKSYTLFTEKIKMPGSNFQGGQDNFFGILLLKPQPPLYSILLINKFFIFFITFLFFIMIYIVSSRESKQNILEKFAVILNKHKPDSIDTKSRNANLTKTLLNTFETELFKNEKNIECIKYNDEKDKIYQQKISEHENLINSFKTEVTELKKELSKFKPAMSSSMFAVAITDILGNIVYVNKSFEGLTGYKFEEVTGKNPRILKTEYHSQYFYKEMWDAITSGKIWRGEILNKRKNGDTYWEYMTITPLYDENADKIAFFMAIKENITEKKKKQLEAEKKQKIEIKFYKEQLEFVSRALNELKNVLTNIIDNPDKKFKDRDYENLTAIIKSNSSMINELLEYSHSDLQSDRLAEVIFKLSDEFDKLKNIIDSKIKNNDISFTISYSAELSKKMKGYFNGIYQSVIILMDFMLINMDSGNIALTAELANETENKIFVKFLLNWNIFERHTSLNLDNLAENTQTEETNQYWHIFYVKKLLELINSELFFEKNNNNSYVFGFCKEFKIFEYEPDNSNNDLYDYDRNDLKNKLIMLEGIDYTHGMKIVNNNTEVYCRILKMFYERQCEYINQLAKLSIPQDIRKIRDIIHTVKG
ncbi:PAS domain S-box protein, partial [Candidatus Dependentiae bacterium]|nr:PAS domain S-box protein [Candidatus Dependentiae bacterium]